MTTETAPQSSAPPASTRQPIMAALQDASQGRMFLGIGVGAGLEQAGIAGSPAEQDAIAAKCGRRSKDGDHRAGRGEIGRAHV